MTVELEGGGAAGSLVHELERLELPEHERPRLGDRVVVSSGDGVVFLYADDEDVAREVDALVRARLAELDLEARTELTRWHPAEQRWEVAETPLPRTEEELEAERARLQRREAAESLASGAAEWEVRVELPGHHETTALAERLEGEGLPVVRRWQFLLVGAVNEDEAHALAERLRAEAPDGSRVAVEPGGGMAWEVAPRNPFAIFGGFGG